MSSTTNKIIFSILGFFKDVSRECPQCHYKTPVKREFVADSLPYLHDRSSKQPLDKQFTCDFTTKIPTLTEAQRDYHFVLMQYIGEHCGYPKQEAHETLMRAKWGTKKCTIGKYTEMVRESIADIAKFPLPKMQEQIDFDLSVCADLEIRVPTKKELGYIDENEKITPITNYPEDIGTPTF
jgi:hypothetical protein